MKDYIQTIIDDSINTKQKLFDLSDDIVVIAKVIIDALKKGKKILVCGNGGSAADAQHFVAELVVRFEKERAALPAIALTNDPSIITACSNDYGFDQVFSRQVTALGDEGDVLVGITTSGNSPNILAAFDVAKKNNLKTICLNGKSGGSVNGVDVNLIIPSNITARIQESHITIIHILCGLIDKEFEE